MKKGMTSLERVLKTLGHEEPDRVPLFLTTTMHGAKELGLTIEDYFKKADNLVEGQLRLRKKYRNDFINAFFHASLEVEAWGGESIFIDNGPPNAGQPVISNPEVIPALTPPVVRDTACLQKVLEAIAELKIKVEGEVPIIGVVMSPFSLPVMQMGYPAYLDLMMERPQLFASLMKINEQFCVDWANAQLAAGATAICYFDPLASSTNTPPEIYRRTGFPTACRTLELIQGPTATHMASGRCLPIIDDLAATGTAIVGVGGLENLAEIKTGCQNKLTVLGNLNGIAMRKWTPEVASETVKNSIEAAGPGGGFILSDGHGGNSMAGSRRCAPVHQ
jgi:uroporphyrinogen decarboxylase